jgi:hypothetical protein
VVSRRHTFILLGVRAVPIKLIASGRFDAGSKPIEMLESSGEVSNVEWSRERNHFLRPPDASGRSRAGLKELGTLHPTSCCSRSKGKNECDGEASSR